jgi:lysophospholipase L1-like esterase
MILRPFFLRRAEGRPKAFKAVAALWIALAAQVCFGAPVRIMPLGDSITQALSDQLSYRYNLWIRLIDTGASFGFVGSQDSNYGGNPVWPEHLGQSFDRHHEGHAGVRSDEIAAALPGWMSGYVPNVVLMHVGTNDVLQGRPNDETVFDLKQIIDLLRARNSHVAILLATLIPVTYLPQNDRITELNARIGAIVLEKNTAQSPVILVDQNAGFDVVADTSDGVHPSPSGEEKMARKWFEALQLFLVKSNTGLNADGHLTLSFSRVSNAVNLTYTVEVSGDLAEWNSGVGHTADVSVIDDGTGNESVLVRDEQSAATAPRRFIRLRVDYSP